MLKKSWLKLYVLITKIHDVISSTSIYLPRNKIMRSPDPQNHVLSRSHHLGDLKSLSKQIEDTKQNFKWSARMSRVSVTAAAIPGFYDSCCVMKPQLFSTNNRCFNRAGSDWVPWKYELWRHHAWKNRPNRYQTGIRFSNCSREKVFWLNHFIFKWITLYHFILIHFIPKDFFNNSDSNFYRDAPIF